MSTVEEVFSTLKDMGFDEERVKKALTETGWKGVEPAMDWLLSNRDLGDDDDDMIDDDKKINSLSEPEPKKILSEEEKAEQLKRLEILRVKKRDERIVREAKEAQEREKRRVQDGKTMSDMKAKFEETEMKLIVEQRKREKKEEAMAKARVRAQIEEDKKARKERDAIARGKVLQDCQVQAVKPTNVNYSQTRLQIRLIDGTSLIQTFNSKEALSAVRLWVQLQNPLSPTSSDNIKFITTFPRREFVEDDYDKPLEALGLVPSAVLMVKNEA